jgi:hypothetical protein
MQQGILVAIFMARGVVLVAGLVVIPTMGEVSAENVNHKSHKKNENHNGPVSNHLGNSFEIMLHDIPGIN